MRNRLTQLFGLLALLAIGGFLAGSAAAQEKQVEQRPAGPHEVKVELKHSTVVLVEGNHLVTRLENGTVEAVQVPEDFRFHMDGRLLSVHELQPGMIITEETIVTTKPMIVKTVEVKNGTIWNINGPNVIIQDANNKLHEYRIPDWAKVTVSGQEMTVFDLRKGMKINTTIVTEEPITVVEQETKTRVRHPAAAPREAMKEPPEAAQPPEVPQAQPAQRPEPAMTELPKTASPLPLVGLVGLLSLAASFGFRLLRKRY